jgi:murein DD-endopeptidase MepM/ murein hydrolase activator NlpD
MQTALQKVKRVVFVIYLVALHGVVLYFVGERIIYRFTSITPVDSASVSDPSEKKAIPTPIPVPESFADQIDANSNMNADAATNSNSGTGFPQAESSSPGFMIPVAGVRPDQLIDTFSAGRSEGRYHDAIDIPAAPGTPVVAATDGEIVKLFESERGGITIYQLTSDRRFILYYAHLQRRVDEISVGTIVRKGTTIGFVGDTGNAGLGNFHLHFSIAVITDPKRFWSGTYINPYPILKNGSYPQ